MRVKSVRRFLAAALLIPGACSTPECSGSGQPEIRVVSTLAELRRQPALELGEGIRARLGIDRLRCEAGSGVHLYCLTEGFLPSRRGQGRRLGPFQVRGPAGEESKDLWEVQARSSKDSSPEKLFMVLVPILGPGDSRIQVRMPAGKVIASVRVHGDPPVEAPWMPWAKFSGTQELRLVDPKDPDASYGYVANPAAGLALPSWPGVFPVDLGELLPRLLPEKVDPDFKLAIRGRELRVKAAKEFLTARPDWHFLCRWWVNGVPFRPPQVGAWSDENGIVIEGRNLVIEMDFDPARLRAGRGDRIGLQLLYSRSGWTFTGPMESALASMDGEPDVRLTNRIEWTVP
ncbi:MAG: hypothetical protein HY293_07145 [Planctomycetes bacterium]|nr:hypothetical protein [Planctomycetota bacterium]